MTLRLSSPFEFALPPEAGLIGLLLREHSHRPPAQSFFTRPPTDCFPIDDPGRALCPTTSHRLRNGPPNSLAFHSIWKWMAHRCDLRRMHGRVVCGRRRRWRDAMFEGPFRRSPGRTKFSEPKNDTAMRFIRRWSSRRPSTSRPSVWCARSAGKGDQQPLPPPASLAFHLFALLDFPIPI